MQWCGCRYCHILWQVIIPFLKILTTRCLQSWWSFGRIWDELTGFGRFQYVTFNNTALIHLNYQWQHSLQSSIPITQTCKKWDMTLSSSVMHDRVHCHSDDNGNDLGHAWHTWCKKGTNGKRMSCSLLTAQIQIFKSIYFRTIGH